MTSPGQPLVTRRRPKCLDLVSPLSGRSGRHLAGRFTGNVMHEATNDRARPYNLIAQHSLSNKAFASLRAAVSSSSVSQPFTRRSAWRGGGGLHRHHGRSRRNRRDREFDLSVLPRPARLLQGAGLDLLRRCAARDRDQQGAETGPGNANRRHEHRAIRFPPPQGHLANFILIPGTAKDVRLDPRFEVAAGRMLLRVRHLVGPVAMTASPKGSSRLLTT